MPKIVSDEQVYTAAIEAVIEWGYSGATTKQIAEAADISEVTLFRKYGNKADLLKQAITAMADQMDFQSAARYTGDVAADLLRVVHMYQGSAVQNGQFIHTILLEIRRNPELNGVIDRPMSMINAIGQLIAQYQAQGVLKQEHPLNAVAGLLGPLISTNLLRGAVANMPIPPIDLSNHVACFLNGRYTAP